VNKGEQKINFPKPNTMSTKTETESQNDKPGNPIWERNRLSIVSAITRLMRQNERIPTKNEIAEHTGLGRTTIYKHMKALGEDTSIEDELQQFNALASQVLASLGTMALAGDIKATRLSLELMGISKRRPQDNLKKDKSTS